MTPEVSVVIPTRNRWNVLSQHALATALSQEDVDLEVVVVDDGSTEPPPEHLDALADRRVRVIRRTHEGQARARNTGIAEARGEWIAFLDDDDLWSPQKLRTQLDAVAGRPSFAYASVVVLDSSGRVLETVAAPEPRSVSRVLLAENVIITPSTVLARTDLVRRLGGFDERISELTDWDLWIRLAQAGAAAASRDVLVGYLIHSHNRRAAAADEIDIFGEYAYLARKHQKARSAEGVALRSDTFAKWVATGHLRSGRRLPAARVYLDSALGDRSFRNLTRAGAALLGERASFAWLRRTLPVGRKPACPPWLEPLRHDLAV